MADQTSEKTKKKGIGVTFKVSAKGAVSVYGLGRFPVTLYREQWVRLLERTDDLRRFMEEHADELKAKGDQSATAAPEVAEGAPIVGSAGDASEVATTVEDAGAPVTPGSEVVAAEPEAGYHDDYPPGERSTDPWRPGQAPGTDGVREGEVRGVRDGEPDRDDP